MDFRILFSSSVRNDVGILTEILLALFIRFSSRSLVTIGYTYAGTGDLFLFSNVLGVFLFSNVLSNVLYRLLQFSL